MNKLGATRLLKLADKLETIREETFNMGTWAYRDDPKIKCATSACALGWATTVFPRSLKLVPKYEYDEFAANVQHINSGFEGVAAGEKFFNLSTNDADWIFNSGFNATAKEKAKEIRDLVKSYGY